MKVRNQVVDNLNQTSAILTLKDFNEKTLKDALNRLDKVVMDVDERPNEEQERQTSFMQSLEEAKEVENSQKYYPHCDIAAAPFDIYG